MARKSNDEGFVRELSYILANVKKLPLMVAVSSLVLFIAVYSVMTMKVQDPSIFLSQSSENIYNATAVIKKTYEDECIQHLSSIKLPSYIEQHIVHDNDIFTSTITVKYSVDDFELERYYFQNSDSYKKLKDELARKGFEIRENQ